MGKETSSVADMQRACREMKELNKVMANRRGLEFPDADLLNQDMNSAFNLKGFDRITDPGIVNSVYNALLLKSYTKIVANIAATFEIDYLHICLISTRNGSRGGVKCRLLRLRVGFCEDFNEFLKDEVAGRFDTPTRSWGVVLNNENLAILERHLHEYFSVVVDLDTLNIFKGPAMPVYREPVSAPVSVPIIEQHLRFDEILHALNTIRPEDHINQNTVWVHNGEKFIHVSPGSGVTFFLPCALLRFGVPGAQLRYALFMVANPNMYEIAFGQNKKVGQLIANHIEGSRAAGAVAAVMDG